MWSKFDSCAVLGDESLSNMFQVNGLLKISKDPQTANNKILPTINATFNRDKIVIGIDESIIIFNGTNLECQCVSFDYDISCFAVSTSNDLVICCLSNCAILGILNGKEIFNKPINDDDHDSFEKFVDIFQSYDGYDIMLSNGTIYKIVGLDQNFESSTNSVSLVRISNTKLPEQIQSFCYVNFYKNWLYIASGSEFVYFITKDCVEKISFSGIKKIFKSENIVMGLTTNGSLVNICPFSKTVYKTYQGNITDFRILEDSESYVQLLVLIATSNYGSIRIFDYPSMLVKMEVKLSSPTWLITQQKPSMDMHFLKASKNTTECVNSVELLYLSENNPKERFKNLLSKGLFDEAEKFAKEFDLSLEPIRQTKVQSILHQLIHITSQTAEFMQLFDSVMSLLNEIEDKNFFLSIYMYEIPNRRCLTYFLKFIISNIDSNHHENEMNTINELLLRLETLRLIDPEECNLQWRKFLIHDDLSQVAMEVFKTDVLQSSIIWSRHSCSILSNLNIETFLTWINCIPSCIEPFLLIQWMKHFLPSFLQAYPKEMTLIVEWCITRTRSFQFSSRSSWPEIGLEFLNNVQIVFKDVNFLLADIRRLYSWNMEKIQNLIFVLEEMAVLKNRFQLIVTLDDYKQSSIYDNAFYLLQRIQIKNMRKVVSEFIYPLFLEKGLCPQGTIFKYIESLCGNKCFGLWQERAVIAIDLLTSEDHRLRAALMVLKASPVPWSESVLPLAILGSSSTNPIASSIHIESKTQAIKSIKMKYNWPVDFLDLQQDRMKLIFRILRISNTEMVQDVKTIIDSSKEIAHEAYFHLVFKLIELNKIEEVVKLVSDVSKDLDAYENLLVIINDSLTTVMNETENMDLCECCFEVMKIISRQSDIYDERCLKKSAEKIAEMKNLTVLRNQLAISLIPQYCGQNGFEHNSTISKLFFQNCVEELVKNDENTNTSRIIELNYLLITTFKINVAFGYKTFVEKINNIFVSCRLVDKLSTSVTHFNAEEINDTYDLALILIAQQIEYLSNHSSEGFYPHDPLSFPLCYELLIKCILNSNDQQYENIINLIDWIRIGRSFYCYKVIQNTRDERMMKEVLMACRSNQKSNLNRRDSLSMFENDNFTIDSNIEKSCTGKILPVLQCISKALKLVCFLCSTDKFNSAYRELQKIMQIPDANGIPEDVKNGFFKSLEVLLRMKEYNAVTKIMNLLFYNQEKNKELLVPSPFVTSVNKKVIKFVLSQKEPKFLDAFRILRNESKRNETIDFLRNALLNNSQKIAFSTFLETYNKYVGNIHSLKDERENRLKFFYYSELCKYDSSFHSKINFETVAIADLSKDLEGRQLSLELLKKLSRDLSWDYQKALIQQMKIALRSQRLEFEIEIDTFGKETIKILSTVEIIREKCSVYASEITNYSLLANEMQSFFQEINYYFYEVYIYVLELIGISKELSFDLKIHLNILKNLQSIMIERRRGIEQTEMETWMKLQPENSVLPPISKYRLPFKPSMEKCPEDFLNTDLNVENFEKFVTLISLHASISKSDIDERLEVCAFKAVKNSVMDMRAKVELNSGSEWSLKSSSNAALQAILRMVRFIKDKSKRLAILYFHVNHSLPGSDQVEAAYECWKFAVENEEEILKSQKYGDLVERIRRKFPILQTQHLLHVYGLAEEYLMQLIELPNELITALYNHNSILSSQKKDINKLCRELALLFKIDLECLQLKLLHSWLIISDDKYNNNQNGDINDTVYEDYMGMSLIKIAEDIPLEEYVVRAHYILNNWDRNKALSFLGNEMLSNNGLTDNQLQIYGCFSKLAVNDSEILVDLINHKDFLLIKCCNYLGHLGIAMNPESLEASNKIQLLKDLWTSNHNNKKCLETMTFICIGFEIYLPQIWSGILKQMISMKMIQSLTTLVEVLSTKSQLLHLESLKQAWEFIIQEPFLSANKNRDEEREERLHKSLILLQKCPISTFLKLDTVIDICIRLDRPHMAAFILIFLNEDKRDKYVKLFECVNKTSLQRELIELEEFGIAPIITKSIFGILNL